MKCEYGCGAEATFQLKNKKWCCSKSPNSCPINKRKNSDKIKEAHKERRCVVPFDRTTSWNKGLTKETDERVLTITKKNTGKTKGGHLHTEETKRLLSQKRIEFLENHPHIKWFQLPNGVKVQGKWEFNVGLRLIENGFNVQRTRIKYDGVRTYTPDFRLDDGTFIEVKGWLSNRDIEKYKKVFRDNPNLKIFLIRNVVNKNYTNFINGMISHIDCEDLCEAIYKTV